MNTLNETAAADESLDTAFLSSPQCAAPQRFQKIKRKSRASPETERKKPKSTIGKQGENPSATEPRYGGNSNRFGLLAHLTADKQVGNEIGDLYDQPSTSHQAAIAAAKRDAASAGTTSSAKRAQSKPPPIVMEGVDDVYLMMQSIENIVDLEKIEARASMSGVLRLYAADANTFRTIVNWLEIEEYEFHCYQLKEDRPYRVCVKGLHHSTLHHQIKDELEKIGHKVLDIHTPLRRNEPGTSKASPVNMFFLNIAAAANNKEILAVKALCHMRVVIEPLRKRNAIVQCHRCQQIGHTAKYCRKAHICVKCAGEHPAKDCTRPRIELCTCYNCGGQHPANYKGCSKLQAFLQRSRPRSGVAGRTEVSDRPTPRGLAGGKEIPSSRGGISYADVARGSIHHKQPMSLTHQQQKQKQQPYDGSPSRQRSRSRTRASRGTLQRSTDASSSIEAILQTLNENINSLRSIQEKQMELMMMMMKQQQQQSHQQGQIINLLTALQARQAP
uniref:Nucleic-acid-binding protein from transposon X-element n=1 Tax=Drosophila melanogaster TaxID=7227 RepID=GAGXE_DROME|nr:RecName: Full=Nucleic-acid-binding protein from transposon X-element [Drosophila melanogaster]AAF81410.1 unknown [Drosophila melanogaster]